jgi:glycosidase
MFVYIRRLLQWRKTSEAVRNGKFCHFIPQDGMYAYFRFTGKETVMVVLNNNEDTKTLETRRFDEFMNKYKSGTDVVTGKKIDDLGMLTIPGKSALIMELR